MDLYLVKDFVEVNDVFSGEFDLEDLECHFYYYNMVKPVNQSKSGRDFAAKVRKIGAKNYHDGMALFRIDSTDWVNIAFRWGLGYGTPVRCGFHSIFGKGNFKMSATLSLCHLETKDTPVNPESLITIENDLKLKVQDDFDQPEQYLFADIEPEVDEKVESLLAFEGGAIYIKLTLVVKVNEEGVRKVMEESEENCFAVVALNRRILEEEIGTDLEISCGGGNKVKCHTALLGGGSKVFRAMFENEGWREAGTRKLEMEGMSEEGVRALLGWIYWRDERMEADVAVEVLIAGDKWEVEGVVERMEEIILRGRGYDEMWFSVESLISLFTWARNLERMDRLREKAVDVLKLFAESFPEKLDGSEEYQEWIRNNPEVAKEWTEDV